MFADYKAITGNFEKSIILCWGLAKLTLREAKTDFMLRTMPSYRLKTVQIYCQFLVEDKSILSFWLKTNLLALFGWRHAKANLLPIFGWRQTDRQTNRQTELVEEAPSRSLKTYRTKNKKQRKVPPQWNVMRSCFYYCNTFTSIIKTRVSAQL